MQFATSCCHFPFTFEKLILVCVQTKPFPSVPLPQSHGSHGAVEALHKPHDEGRVRHDEGLAALSRFSRFVTSLRLILKAWNPKTLNKTVNKYKSDNIFQQYVCLYILYVHIIYVLLFRKKARNVENSAFFSLSTVSCRASRCKSLQGFWWFLRRKVMSSMP